MPLPTWNNQPIDPNDIPAIVRESFDVLHTAIGGPSVHGLTQIELLHIVEAASHLENMAAWAHEAVVPAARASGASWGQLAAALGVTRSTAQSRHQRAENAWKDHHAD